jgi:hypothetical protein
MTEMRNKIEYKKKREISKEKDRPKKRIGEKRK